MNLTIKLFRGAILCGLLMLSACSWFEKKTGSEPMDLESFKETADLKELWSTNVGRGQAIGYTQLTPAIDGDKIYTVDWEGILTALDRKNGKKLWSKKLNNDWTGWAGRFVHIFSDRDFANTITGGVGVGGDALFVGTYSGELIAVSKKDGKEIWRKQIKGEITSIPQSNGEVVAVQTTNGKLFVQDAHTGADLWFFENTPPVLTLRGTASPLVTDSAIYAGFSSGRLMAFNPANGLILWDQRIAVPKGRSELDRMVDIHASPVIYNGILYVGTYQGRIQALSRGTGGNVWGKDASTTVGMSANDQNLFVAYSEGQIVALSLTSGEQVWANEKMLRRRFGNTQILGDYIAVVDFEGYMHLLNQSDGQLAARTRVDSDGVRAPLLTTDGEILYVYGNGGDLMAYSIKPKKKK